MVINPCTPSGVRSSVWNIRYQGSRSLHSLDPWLIYLHAFGVLLPIGISVAPSACYFRYSNRYEFPALLTRVFVCKR